MLKTALSCGACAVVLMTSGASAEITFQNPLRTVSLHAGSADANGYLVNDKSDAREWNTFEDLRTAAQIVETLGYASASARLDLTSTFDGAIAQTTTRLQATCGDTFWESAWADGTFDQSFDFVVVKPRVVRLRGALTAGLSSSASLVFQYPDGTTLLEASVPGGSPVFDERPFLQPGMYHLRMHLRVAHSCEPDDDGLVTADFLIGYDRPDGEFLTPDPLSGPAARAAMEESSWARVKALYAR